MSTKIVAARLATSAGVTTVITRSSNPGNILKIVQHVQASRSPASLVTQKNSDDDDHSNNNNHRHTGDEPPSLSASTTSLRLLDLESRGGGGGPAPLHTRFLPSPHPIRDRSFWILHGLKPHGTVYIDGGAHKALVGKAGLLPVGVVDVEGSFAQQEAVRICVVSRRGRRRRRRRGTGPTTTTTTGEVVAVEAAGGGEDDDNNDGSSSSNSGRLWDGPAVEVGRALVNYSSNEIARIKGHQSTEIGALLGYADSEYVAQREHVCFFRLESRPATPVREVMEGHGIGEYESGAGAALL